MIFWQKKRIKHRNIDEVFVGIGYVDDGQFKVAIPYFDKVLASDANNSLALSYKGKALAQLGRHDEAIECYEKALANFEGDDIVLKNKAASLEQLGRFDEAIECYEKILAKDGTDATVLKNKEVSSDQLRRREKASLSLKVLEGYARDAGYAVARIDYDSMDTLNASTGDVIEIKGKRRTVAKCAPLFPSEEEGVIRINELCRNNAGIVIGDTITIRKIKAVKAKKVEVIPLAANDYDFDGTYLAHALEDIPIIKGDKVMVTYYVGRLPFQVIAVTPAADAVRVTLETVFHIVKT